MVKQSKAKRGSAGQAQKLNALFGEDGIDGSTGRAYQPGPSRERKAPPSKEVFEPKRRPNAAIGKKKPAAGAAAPKEGALEPLHAKKQAPAKAAALQPRAAAVKNNKPAASTGDMVAKGKRSEAMAFAQEYSDKLAAASLSGSVQKRLGELAKLERQIKAAPGLTTAQKDAQLERLDKAKTALARQFLSVTAQR